MWLTVGTVGAIELTFRHFHDGASHEHDLAVADAEAHQLCHRLDGRVPTRPAFQQ